jgi:prepilin-type N-terminal cleavage/methylation domain-containing protein
MIGTRPRPANLRRAHPGARPAGFSLLELTLSLTIIALLGALAVPQYVSALARYRADAAARRIVADLAQTQARARALSASQTITFNLAPSTYQITGMIDPDHAATPYVVNLTAEPYSATLAAVSFGGSATLTFDGYGVPASGGTVVVQAGDTQRTVTIDPETGAARCP